MTLKTQTIQFKRINYTDKKVQETFSFGSDTYDEFKIINKNRKKIKNLIPTCGFGNHAVIKGEEIGSENYVQESEKKFLRTRATPADFLLLDTTDPEASTPMVPKMFVDQQLKRGTILTVKDSNIGEISYLDKDYDNHMMAAGYVRFVLRKDEFYTLAFLKNSFFREQLDALVPTGGSSLRHAGMKFLECEIPFPNKNKQECMKFVEELSKGVLRRELQIRKNYEKMNEKFEEIILKKENQKRKKFVYALPKFSDYKENDRMDSGPYQEQFKYYIFLIENFKDGYEKIPPEEIKSGTTNDVHIGHGKINWITPDFFDEQGYRKIKENCHKDNPNIEKSSLIIKNRTNKGLLGEHAGTALFYDFEKLGKGQHSQGCYRVENENYCKRDLKFFTVCLNTRIYRQICRYLTLGSKMPELKVDQISQIPFIKIKAEDRAKLIKTYDKKCKRYEKEIEIIDFEKVDNENLDKLGIFQLEGQFDFLKEILDYCVLQIRNDEELKDIEVDKINFN